MNNQKLQKDIKYYFPDIKTHDKKTQYQLIKILKQFSNINKILFVMLIGIGLISFASPYTAPTYDSINFSLCSGYTAPTYDSINFTLSLSDDCVTDSCSCAGLNTNWEVDLSDYCVIIEDCDLGTGTLNFTGSGNFTIDAVIDSSDLGDPGSNGIIWMNDEGVVNVN